MGQGSELSFSATNIELIVKITAPMLPMITPRKVNCFFITNSLLQVNKMNGVSSIVSTDPITIVMIFVKISTIFFEIQKFYHLYARLYA